jgi:hypothetical protein
MTTLLFVVHPIVCKNHFIDINPQASHAAAVLVFVLSVRHSLFV